MNKVLLEVSTHRSIFPPPPPPSTPPSDQPYAVPHLPPPSPAYVQVQSERSGFNLNEKVSPSILLIIIILAIIFFLSGLVHLLVRFLWRPRTRDPDDIESVTALQGQLQQLFNLHDAGVDQSFIDTLPVFNYKAIIGLKNPFDCAVCLCEFEPDDKLRLLPKCSHAFHMECIDTWLLSHSTCPLCRASLLPDFSPNNSRSPIVLVLESGSESSREIVPDREAVLGRSSSVLTANSLVRCHGENELGSSRRDVSRKSSEACLQSTEKQNSNPTGTVDSKEKVVTVKLGKYRNVDGGESSNINADARRCFSMGSFEYVMDENTLLQVPIRTPMKKQSSKKPALPLAPGYRLAMSECDYESRGDFKFHSSDTTKKPDMSGPAASIADTNGGGAIRCNRKESFSISKIWLREKKDKSNSEADFSRRAFSFRFPVQPNAMANNDANKAKQHVPDAKQNCASKIDISKWGSGGSEFSYDEEIQSYISMDSQPRVPSFARRTLLWLMGRQNKIVNPSSDVNF